MSTQTNVIVRFIDDQEPIQCKDTHFDLGEYGVVVTDPATTHVDDYESGYCGPGVVEKCIPWARIHSLEVITFGAIPV